MAIENLRQSSKKEEEKNYNKIDTKSLKYQNCDKKYEFKIKHSMFGLKFCPNPANIYTIQDGVDGDYFQVWLRGAEAVSLAFCHRLADW